MTDRQAEELQFLIVAKVCEFLGGVPDLDKLASVMHEVGIKLVRDSFKKLDEALRDPTET